MLIHTCAYTFICFCIHTYTAIMADSSPTASVYDEVLSMIDGKSLTNVHAFSSSFLSSSSLFYLEYHHHYRYHHTHTHDHTHTHTHYHTHTHAHAHTHTHYHTHTHAHAHAHTHTLRKR